MKKTFATFDIEQEALKFLHSKTKKRQKCTMTPVYNSDNTVNYWVCWYFE